MYNTDDMALDELRQRALAAYYASGGDELPASVVSMVMRGKRYVVLWRAKRVLACYRVRNDGKLKRLVRLPIGI